MKLSDLALIEQEFDANAHLGFEAAISAIRPKLGAFTRSAEGLYAIYVSLYYRYEGKPLPLHERDRIALEYLGDIVREPIAQDIGCARRSGGGMLATVR